jgi:exopolysaccharide biosynthesis predicted pyruvyltransferase EpsI
MSNPNGDRRAAALVIAELQGRIDQVLGPRISKGTPVALLDFPDHGNVGDSAIWLGEIAFLARQGARIVYQCDLWSYSEKTLRAKIGDGLILIHGGGNFGTLWPRHQTFREQVIKSFPNNPIIQLPQTIYFEDQARAAQAEAIINGHGNVTILARDPRSLEFADAAFTSKNILCPDMAFCIGPLASSPPAVAVSVLARTDRETVADSPMAELGGWTSEGEVVIGDWVHERKDAATATNLLLKQVLVRYQDAWAVLGPTLNRLRSRLARRRLRKGLDILCKGQVVITDRLHAHILCVLLDKPHVVLDNSYWKIRAFFDCWTSSAACGHWAESLAEAKEITGKLLRRAAPAPVR